MSSSDTQPITFEYRLQRTNFIVLSLVMVMMIVLGGFGLAKSLRNDDSQFFGLSLGLMGFALILQSFLVFWKLGPYTELTLHADHLSIPHVGGRRLIEIPYRDIQDLQILYRNGIVVGATILMNAKRKQKLDMDHFANPQAFRECIELLDQHLLT